MGMFDGLVEKMSSMVDDVKKVANEPRIWEYETCVVDINTTYDFSKHLNSFGAEGWEAFSVTPNPFLQNEFLIILKREVKKEPSTS